jgi:hypothetical protein
LREFFVAPEIYKTRVLFKQTIFELLHLLGILRVVNSTRSN